LDEVEPVVWRRFTIPAETTFKRLHDTIQIAMGWNDVHLFEFDFKGEPFRIEIVEDEEMYEQHLFAQRNALQNRDVNIENEFEKRYVQKLLNTEMRKARTTKLPKYVEKYQQFVYRYDFGDDWKHKLQLEEVILDYAVGYPILLEGDGACPPEDVGGAGGYKEFLEAWSDPTHSLHNEMKQWVDGSYKQELDIKHINKMMKEFLQLKKIKK
jgi:hypothetical protein